MCQKNIAIDAAEGDWILQLDADEVVSPELANEIGLIVDNERNTANGYWVNRRNWFLSRFLTKGGQYPDPTLRLYRRGFGKLPAKDVHEQAIVTGEVGHLKNDLLHYRDVTFEKYMQGFNRYSSFIAGQMTGVKTNFINSIVYLIIKPALVFLKIYIRHRGYVDGFPGLIFALHGFFI
jgi:glycosyltransferase involved in cell wall biosynthesis